MDSSERTRRSLGQALQSGELSEQARAFVAGTRTGTSDAASVETVADDRREGADSPKQNGVSKFRPGAALPTVEGISPITVRLPAGVTGRLLRASLERKLRREEPFTQQDIVAEALQDWLCRHGHDA